MASRVVRRAVEHDLTDLVRLRAEMFRAMGNADHAEQRWQDSAREWFRHRLDDPRFRIVVVESNNEVVATAMGALRDSAPSPSAPGGGDVLVSNICTDERARRRGHATAALEAVLQWSATTGASGAELMATDAGYSIYEAAGFRAATWPAMRAPLPNRTSGWRSPSR